MGGGSYSNDNSLKRRMMHRYASEDLIRKNNMVVPDNYQTKAQNEVFQQRQLHHEMSPYGVKIRESRDSAEHPKSVAIIIGMDETGSMGVVPDLLVKEGLPHMMNAIYAAGVQDPQILFMGLGDHNCDRAPLQVGQFETSDELLDKWLMATYLEGGGGGNGGESYALAWFFASKHTAIDCHEKRGQKGVLITIGDEACHRDYPGRLLDSLMDGGENKDVTSAELLAKAREKYHCFHVHIAETSEGHNKKTIDGWREIMGDNLLIANSYRDVPKIITDAILSVVKGASPVTNVGTANPVTPVADKPSDQML